MDLPLHPMLVHLPLGLALLLPFAVGAVLWFARHRPDPHRSWRVACPLFIALALAATAAVLSGQRDEEAAERVVPEAAIELHEERAEVFLYLAWIGAAVAAAGLTAGAPGRAARVAAAGLAVVLAVVALGVGHAGGVLVYRHGAAQVHVAAGGAAAAGIEAGDDDDD